MKKNFAGLWMLSALISLTLLAGGLGGCANAAKFEPAKVLPPIVAAPSVSPAAADNAAAVGAVGAPIAQLKVTAPTLTAANVESVKPALLRAISALDAAWNLAVKTAGKAQEDAKANDSASAAVMAAVQARDAEIARLGKQSADQQARIEADATAFQKKIDTYAILLTVIVAALVGLLVYMTQLKAAICTAIGGAGAVLFLFLVGWVDRFKVEIGLSILAAGILYVVAETLYRRFHNKLSWPASLGAALSESPLNN